MPFFLNIFVKDSLTPAVPNGLLCLLAKAFAMGAVLWISRWALLLKAALSVHLNKMSPAVFTLQTIGNHLLLYGPKHFLFMGLQIAATVALVFVLCYKSIRALFSRAVHFFSYFWICPVAWVLRSKCWPHRQHLHCDPSVQRSRQYLHQQFQKLVVYKQSTKSARLGLGGGAWHYRGPETAWRATYRLRNVAPKSYGWLTYRLRNMAHRS